MLTFLYFFEMFQPIEPISIVNVACQTLHLLWCKCKFCLLSTSVCMQWVIAQILGKQWTNTLLQRRFLIPLWIAFYASECCLKVNLSLNAWEFEWNLDVIVSLYDLCNFVEVMSKSERCQPLKFFDFVFTKNAPKLPFLVQVPNFWKKTFLDTCNCRIL